MNWQAFTEIWPIAIVLSAFGIRVEVAQALNRQRMKNLEDNRGVDIEGLHSRVARHETQTEKMLGEIRQDIKEILRLSTKS